MFLYSTRNQQLSDRVCMISKLVGGEWSVSHPRFTPGERVRGNHWIEGWVGPRAGLDKRGKEKILDLTGTRTPTPRSSSLYPVVIHTALSRLLYFTVAWLNIIYFKGSILDL
jgi:hypothetical protein